MSTFRIQPPLNRAVVKLAATQHTVIGLDQLRELGLSASAVRDRAASGRLHRIHHAVYSLVPPELLTRDGRYMAAVLACGPEAVLSYRSAAALHELRHTDRSKIDVTIPGRSPRRHPGIDLHRSTTLRPEDTTRVRNIPVTTVERTVLDLGQVIDRRGVERACNQAEILDVFDLDGLLDQIGRNHGRLAARRLRAVLDDHYPGSTPTWSRLEEKFLALCRAARLPGPEVNAWITPDDGDPTSIRVDFVWREQRLIVETDGHSTHRTRQAFEHDRTRDQRLTVAGWTVIRITWRQLSRHPEQVAETIARLLWR
jgi:REase_MTES_1575